MSIYWIYVTNISQALKAGGNVLPEEVDDAINHVNVLLLEMSNEYNAHIKNQETIHHAAIQGLQQQLATLTTEKQMAERKVKEHEAQSHLNQTKTVSENRAMKQQLESTQEENKRLRQKILFLSSQAANRPSSIAALGEGTFILYFNTNESFTTPPKEVLKFP